MKLPIIAVDGRGTNRVVPALRPRPVGTPRGGTHGLSLTPATPTGADGLHPDHDPIGVSQCEPLLEKDSHHAIEQAAPNTQAVGDSYDAPPASERSSSPSGRRRGTPDFLPDLRGTP
jgi:hypothetical protein